MATTTVTSKTTRAQCEILPIFGSLRNPHFIQIFLACPKKVDFCAAIFGAKFVTQKFNFLSFKTRENLFLRAKTYVDFFMSQKVVILPTVYCTKLGQITVKMMLLRKERK